MQVRIALTDTGTGEEDCHTVELPEVGKEELTRALRVIAIGECGQQGRDDTVGIEVVALVANNDRDVDHYCFIAKWPDAIHFGNIMLYGTVYLNFVQ